MKLPRMIPGLCASLAASAAMAQTSQKISQMPNASALTGSEYLAGVQSGANVKITPAQLQTYMQPVYTGQVATRSYVNQAINASGAKQIMARSMHQMRSTTPTIRLVFWGGYADVAGEHANASAGTVTASIEYPSGTCTPVTFNSATQGTVPTGALLVSDPLAISIPNGAIFWIRSYQTNAGGVPFMAFNVASDPYDQATYGASGVTDQTQTCGAVSTTSAGVISTPAAVVGTTHRPSVYIEGDSRAQGWDDPPSDISGDTGNVARFIGPSYAYINGGILGAKASVEATQFNVRKQLAAYTSMAVQQLGVNDLGAGNSPATVQANRQTVNGLLNANTKTGFTVGVTLEPETTSTDGWTTIANQTVMSFSSNIGTFNGLVRVGLAGESGVIDAAFAVDPAGTQKWMVGPVYTGASAGGATTLDGVHANNTGAIQLRNNPGYQLTAFLPSP